MVTPLLRELAGPFPPLFRFEKPCSRTARHLIDAWNHVCVQAISTGSAEALHATRDDYHTVLVGHMKMLDGYLMVQSRLRDEFPESEPAERVALARADLQKHYDSLFPRWQTIDDLEAMLLERASLSNDQLKALAAKYPPPQAWYDEADAPPAAQE